MRRRSWACSRAEALGSGCGHRVGRWLEIGPPHAGHRGGSLDEGLRLLQFVDVLFRDRDAGLGARAAGADVTHRQIDDVLIERLAFEELDHRLALAEHHRGQLVHKQGRDHLLKRELALDQV